MVKYNLEAFESWLKDEENPSNMSGATKEWWEFYLRYYETHPEIWEGTVEQGMRIPIYDGIKELTEYDKLMGVLQNAIFTWKSWVDRVRPKSKKNVITFQEWLNEKYPTWREKERVGEINIEEINQERETRGMTRLLLDGEMLYLTEYSNLHHVNVSGKHLKVKLNELEINSSSLSYLDCSQNNLISLDLSCFPNLIFLDCSDNQLTSLDLTHCRELFFLNYSSNKIVTHFDLSKCKELTKIYCYSNQLTSAEFLGQLSCPEKLRVLCIFNNNIRSTNIDVFSKFINLEVLKIGTKGWVIKKSDKLNRFFGSLESWKRLTKLEDICIEATDVESGLEYLPMILAEVTSNEAQERKGERGGYYKIECFPHSVNAKVVNIQNELKLFNYDLLAWQSVHPKLMFRAQPELFTSLNSQERWVQVLEVKIKSAEQELEYIRETSEINKVAEIYRLETQIKLLEETKRDFQNNIYQELFDSSTSLLDQQNEQTILKLKVEEKENENEISKTQINQNQVEEVIEELEIAKGAFIEQKID